MKLKRGQLVKHKISFSHWSDVLIVLRNLDDERVECRYFNDAQKKFVSTILYEFELEPIKGKK